MEVPNESGFQSENSIPHSELSAALETHGACRHMSPDALMDFLAKEREGDFTLEGVDIAYRALIEQMREGAATLDASGIVTYANKSLATLLNRPLEGILGAPFSHFFTLADGAWVVAMQAECIASGQPSKADVLVNRFQGAPIPVALSILPFDTGDRKILCVTAADLTDRLLLTQAKARQETVEALRHQNATLEALVMARTEELKRTLEDLQDTEHKFKTVADFTYDWEYWQDAQGNFQYVSPSCERISGCRPVEFMADPGLFSRLIHPEDRARVQSHVDSVNQESEACELEFRLMARNGDVHWIVQTRQSVLDRDGTRLGLRGSIRDITESKRAQEALLDSSKTLQRLSARLMTAQEEERQRVARELHDSLGSSLAAVKFLGERALEGACAKGIAGHMAGLRTLVQVVHKSIDEVRRISMALRPSTLDDLGLLPTISWLIRDYQTTYPGFLLETTIEANEAGIPDEIKVHVFRILQEALNNAAKYSEASKIIITLKEESGALCMKVEDDGVGFDCRVKREPNPRGGHGIPFMKERAELHGGEFAIASAPGNGTQIILRWPIPTL